MTYCWRPNISEGHQPRMEYQPVPQGPSHQPWTGEGIIIPHSCNPLIVHWLGNATEAPLSPDVTKKNAESKPQVPEREQSFHKLGMRGRQAVIGKAQWDFNRRKSRAEAPKASVLMVSLLKKKKRCYLEVLQRIVPNKYSHIGPSSKSPFILGISWSCGTWLYSFYIRITYSLHYLICSLNNLKSQEMFMCLAFFLIAD